MNQEFLTWQRCLPGGCFADAILVDDVRTRWRAATRLINLYLPEVLFGLGVREAVEEGLGEVFNAQNISAKRPGTGISPMRWDEVIGRRAVRDFAVDELIEL